MICALTECRRSVPFDPRQPAKRFCSTACAAKSRWEDEETREASERVEAESAAELAGLRRAKGCRCIGETAEYVEDDERICVPCGRAKPEPVRIPVERAA